MVHTTCRQGSKGTEILSFKCVFCPGQAIPADAQDLQNGFAANLNTSFGPLKSQAAKRPCKSHVDLSLGALLEELVVEDLVAELLDSDEELEEPSSSSDPYMPSVLLAFWRLHSLSAKHRPKVPHKKAASTLRIKGPGASHPVPAW